jgi:hypothetical protein
MPFMILIINSSSQMLQTIAGALEPELSLGLISGAPNELKAQQQQLQQQQQQPQQQQQQHQPKQQ